MAEFRKTIKRKEKRFRMAIIMVVGDQSFMDTT
jgi:hypothetical protein